ncbi:BN159_2729 family protein [Streptomyces sp. NPDC048696]|uniref:BN159_2729 family protein n=1 Tax=Streptomyces sp. NPDC048696 TaxID=3365585 RepID=UPI0037219889
MAWTDLRRPEPPLQSGRRARSHAAAAHRRVDGASRTYQARDAPSPSPPRHPSVEQAMTQASPERAPDNEPPEMIYMRRPKPSPQNLTELEEQAIAWDATCGRARTLAAQIEALYGETHGLQGVRVDQDRLIVSVHVTDLHVWAEWVEYFSVTDYRSGALPHTYGGSGHRDGISVWLLGYDGPQLEQRAMEVAQRPHRHGAVVYDLALPHRDINGNVWVACGKTAEGMPLLSQVGRPERCSLAHVIDFVGPLLAVRDAVLPALPGGEAA